MNMREDMKRMIVLTCVGILLLMVVLFVIGYRMGFLHGVAYEEPVIRLFPNLTNITQIPPAP